MYGGYKTEFSGVGLDVGAISYRYPGTNVAANTSEAYIGLSYGPITFKTSYVLSKNYFASTIPGRDASGTVYYDLTVSQEIAPKLVASAHAGYTDYKESAADSTNGAIKHLRVCPANCQRPDARPYPLVY